MYVTLSFQELPICNPLLAKRACREGKASDKLYSELVKKYARPTEPSPRKLVVYHESICHIIYNARPCTGSSRYLFLYTRTGFILLECCKQVNDPLETMLKYAWCNLHNLASHSVFWDPNYINIYSFGRPNKEQIYCRCKVRANVLYRHSPRKKSYRKGQWNNS